MYCCTRRLITLAIGVGALAACSRDQKPAAEKLAVDTGNAATVTPPVDPDHEFLRAMSDHHKGLVAIVHQTVDRKEKLAVRGDATRLDAEQDKELDDMVTLLEKSYNDPYDPKIMAEHQAMLDTLKTLHGAAYDSAFLKDVIRHHQEALSMIDAFLPNSKDPAVRSMAEAMRAAQSKEIAEFQKQLGVR